MFAIVDIETTGGNASSGNITEIAVILHDGKNYVDGFHSLINPESVIPRYISALTGITNEMVKDAPSFSEVAPQLFSLLENKIFVAHNVNFDFSFIRHHLSKNGYELMPQKLCTVRMSRKIIPGHGSYSLGNICRDLGIAIQGRHRAMGDARATAQLFSLLLTRDKQGYLSKMLKKGSREAYLPLNLQAQEIDKLPHSPGIYYFTDGKKKVIYVGKATNLQQRVTSHFSNNAPTAKKQELIRNVHGISYQLAGSAFTASIMESLEIKKHWPKFNKSQKRIEYKFGLCVFQDQRGINRIAISALNKSIRAIHQFYVLNDGYRLLWKLVKDFQLCPKCCFLQETDHCVGLEEGYCSGICNGQEDISTYNERVKLALESLKEIQPDFAIMEKGRNENEKAIVLVEKGKFYGYGFVSSDLKFQNVDQIKTLIQPFPENEFVTSEMFRYAETFPEKVIHKS
ncbi:MAG: exonuclease domain-containing protein [Chitinophagaceae bacterium]